MAIRTYKVTLDSKNSIAPEPVFLRQGDKTGAVVIDATLMDNGAPVSIDGLTPMFKANTADGQAVIIDSTGFNIVNASGGEFTYQVPNALSAVPGKIMTAYFSFSDTSGSESTFDVAFIIKKAVDTTQAQADDYITIIDGTLQSLQQKIDAMNTDVQTILDAFNQGNLVSIATAQTISGAKTFTAPINGALTTRPATFADFADVAANMNTYAGNWYVMDTPIANSPVADMTWYVVEVIPGNETTDGTIRVNKYDSGNSYFNIPNAGVLGTWHRVATDADVMNIDANFKALITKVPWTSDGIVYKNGWTQHANKLVYTYGSFGDNNFIAVSGQINYPNIPASSNNSVTPFALPISVFNGKNDSHYWAVSPVIANFDGNLYRLFPDAETGDINLHRTINTAINANNMVINFIMIN